MVRRLRTAGRPLGDDRGAVMPMVAMLLVLLLTAAAFAVDLGMQRVVARDMQAVADVAALDMARLLDGRTRQQLEGSPAWAAALQTALDRNDSHVGTLDDAVAVAGRYDPATGAFTEIAPTEVPDAVRVTTAGSTAFAFAPAGGGPDRGGATRSAVATAESGACFSIGSYLARLDPADSPLLGSLLGALGSSVQLDAVAYTGLASTQVDLLGLLGAQTSVGTVDALLEGDQLLSLADFYLATASVLEARSGRTAEVLLLEQIAASVGAVAFDVGDLLSLGTGASSGLGATLNLLDLVTAAAAAATSQHAISVPQAGVALGPLASVQTSLHLIEAPQVACGRAGAGDATARSTQVRVDLAATAADLSIPLPLASPRTRVALTGAVRIADVEGRLVGTTCAPSPSIAVDATGGIQVDLRLEVTVSASILLLGRVDVLGGPIRITGQRQWTDTAHVDVAPDGTGQGTVGEGQLTLPQLHVDTSGLRLLGIPLGLGLDALVAPLLSGLVNPILSGLEGAVLLPVMEAIGLSLDDADVFARSLPRCSEPALRG